MFKPKFAPKIPIKRENEGTVVAGSSSVLSTNVPSASKGSQDGKKADGNRDKLKIKRENHERNQNKAGRGGTWVMPTGTAFFTGNPRAQLATKVNQSISIPVKSDPEGKKSSSSRRVARPNEEIEDVSPNVMEPSSSSVLPMEPDLVDTDSDRSEVGDDHHLLVKSQHELWPPRRYSPLEPLSLPFGPKHPLTRRALANEPILAPPDDLEALDFEERTSLFLVQVPSDLV